MSSAIARSSAECSIAWNDFSRPLSSASDVPHLLYKLRVFGELESLHPMRLQSERTPDPHDGVLRQPHLCGHEPRAPVGAVGRHRFQCLGDDVFNLPIGDFTWRADTRFIQQAV